MDVKTLDLLQMLQEEETPISNLALKELLLNSLNEKKKKKLPVSPNCPRLIYNRPIRNHEHDIYLCIFWLGLSFIMENLLARPQGVVIGIYDDFKKNIMSCIDRMKTEHCLYLPSFSFGKSLTLPDPSIRYHPHSMLDW